MKTFSGQSAVTEQHMTTPETPTAGRLLDIAKRGPYNWQPAGLCLQSTNAYHAKQQYVH